MSVSGTGKTKLSRGIRRGRIVNREKGVTSLGFLILVVIGGLFAFAAIRLAPVYLNYMKVAGVINGVYDEFDSQNPTLNSIRRSIGRRFEVESVSVITERQIKVTQDNGGFVVEAQYDHTTPFLGNLFFTVRFDKSILVRR